MEKVIIHQDFFGAIWFVGWLFTIGYLGLDWKRGILSIIVWPYYLGKHYHKS